MAARAQDGQGEDWLLWGAIAGGIWLLWTVWRDQQATEAAQDDRALPGSPAPQTGQATAPAPDDDVSLPFQGAPPDVGVAGDFLNAVIPQRLSPAGAAFIKQQEGWTPVPMPDAGGHVIGWGHTIQPGERFPQPITPQGQGQQLFDHDAMMAMTLVNRVVKVPLSQNQFDALVDLAFNVPVALGPHSSILRALNAGDYAGAATNFALYNKSQGRVNSDLTKRRAAEARRFSVTGGTS